jgi:hypothetical protein
MMVEDDVQSGRGKQCQRAKERSVGGLRPQASGDG